MCNFVKKWLVLILIVAVVLLLAVYSIPKPFEKLSSSKPEDITSFAVSLSQAGFVDASPKIEQYQMTHDMIDSSHINAVIRLLQQTKYRASLRNFLPKDFLAVEYDGEHPTYNATVIVQIVYQNTDCWTIKLLGDKLVTVSHFGYGDVHLYCLTEPAIMVSLVEYIKQNSVQTA